MTLHSVVTCSDVIDESIEIINKQELLEVNDAGSCKHISLLNNLVDEDELSIIMGNSNGTHSEANYSELEGFANQKSDEIFIENTEKKSQQNAADKYIEQKQPEKTRLAAEI